MARYFVDRSRPPSPRPQAWWDEGVFLPSGSPATITVLEGDDVADTGLVDADGNAIRKRLKDPIGFFRPGA